MNRKVVPKSIKNKLLDESNHQCNICGAKKYLELCHIISMAIGGDNSYDNLIVLCPTCHDTIDRSQIEPDDLRLIKQNWINNKVLGKNIIFQLNERYKANLKQAVSTIMSRNISHSIGHNIESLVLALKEYSNFDIQLEKIANEIASITTESEFLQKILKPLFDAIGFQGVKIFHHTGFPERGKDIVFYDKDNLGSFTFYAVVASVKRIHANSSKTSDAGHYQKILDQVSKCYLFPYKDHNIKSNFFIDKVVIASSSTITEEALEAFNLWETNNRRHLIYLTGFDIAGIRLKLTVKPTGKKA